MGIIYCSVLLIRFRHDSVWNESDFVNFSGINTDITLWLDTTGYNSAISTRIYNTTINIEPGFRAK